MKDCASEIEIEKLVKKHSESVRNISRKYFLAGGNQDDLFQEGMIGFLQAVKSFNKTHGETDSETFKKFCLMCAKRQILDAIKHANRKKHQPLNDYVPIDISHEFQNELTSENPEDILIQREENKSRFEKADLTLTQFEKQVLWQYLEGKNYADIAQSFNREVKSIDNAIQRIKRKLKEGRD